MPGAFDAPFDADDDFQRFDKKPASPWLADDWVLGFPGEDQRDIAEAADREPDLPPPPMQVGDQEADQPEEAADHELNRIYAAEMQVLGYGVDRLPELDEEVGDDDAAEAGDDIETTPEDQSAEIDRVITESLRESIEAVETWAFERAVEFVADLAYPGVGRLVHIAFTLKEVWGDAEALANPDSSRNVHVPLLLVTGGLTIDLNVHLPGADESEDDAPPLSGFLSPGDGGLFGGWEIELDRQAEDDKQEAPQAGEDARTAAAEEAPVSPVIDEDLSPVRRRVKESWRRAVVLRQTAFLLRTRLYARPEFAAEPILVIYDPLTGLGMWLVNPEASDTLAGRRIIIRLSMATGMVLVFIE
jgi:hypothetical protein